MGNAIEFQGVWKQFQRGEIHDSLRDLIPAFFRRASRERQRRNGDWFWALSDVTFNVPQGQSWGIIGPNGAGKSTILKLLSKILRPDRGSAMVHGRLSSLIEVGAGFHYDLTGRENIYLNGAILGMARRDIDRKFGDIVEFAELSSFIDTPIKRYSSGMQARLGFSVAAHMDPEVLLVDEVLSVGDMAFQNRCLERIAQFQREGTTIVLVSHNLQSIARTCQHAIVLDRGRVAASGPPAEVINTYLKVVGSALPRRDHDCPRAELRGIELTTSTGQPVDYARPGDRLRLRARCRFLVQADNITFGLTLIRTSDNTYAYGVHTTELGIAPISASAGDEHELSFEFSANLTRGLYSVSLHARDMSDQTFLDHAHGCALIDMREQISYGGVADLAMSVQMRRIAGGESTALATLSDSGVEMALTQSER